MNHTIARSIILLTLQACSAQPASTSADQQQATTNNSVSLPSVSKKADNQQHQQTKSETNPVSLEGSEVALSISKRLNEALVRCQKTQSQQSCDEARQEIITGGRQLNELCSTGRNFACAITSTVQMLLQAVEKVERVCITKEESILGSGVSVPVDKREQVAALMDTYCQDMKRYAGR